MTDSDHDLWRRIDAFLLDDARASLTFTSRLARENDWGLAFASRVVEEYKRFVFLAMTAGHEVTPSDEVDQAWHLHLTYTRSYWNDFCGRVLGRPLHHGPTKGGPDEGARFEEQYARTLTSYREAFGDTPPRDIWPPAAVRFGEAPSFVRVNRCRVWVLPKPSSVRWGSRSVAIVSATAVLPPLAAGAGDNAVLRLFALLVVGSVLIAILRYLLGGGGSGRGGSGGSWWGGCGGCGGGCGGCGGD